MVSLHRPFKQTNMSDNINAFMAVIDNLIDDAYDLYCGTVFNESKPHTKKLLFYLVTIWKN